MSLMYNDTNVTKTYACKPQISNSKKLIANKINQGANPIMPIIPKLNIVQANDPNIFVKACPAIIFANNRIAKLSTLTK